MTAFWIIFGSVLIVGGLIGGYRRHRAKKIIQAKREGPLWATEDEALYESLRNGGPRHSNAGSKKYDRDSIYDSSKEDPHEHSYDSDSPSHGSSYSDHSSHSSSDYGSSSSYDSGSSSSSSDSSSGSSDY